MTESFDQSIVLFFSQNVGNPTLDTIMQYVTESGEGLWMLAFGILLLIIPKTRRIGITLMILIVISTILTGYIKCGVDRDRPDFEYEGSPFPVKLVVIHTHYFVRVGLMHHILQDMLPDL